MFPLYCWHIYLSIATRLFCNQGVKPLENIVQMFCGLPREYLAAHAYIKIF